jgi:acyl carrier protein
MTEGDGPFGRKFTEYLLLLRACFEWLAGCSSDGQSYCTRMKDKIRKIVREHAGIGLGLDEIQNSTDLYRAGMTSYASVGLMIALENEFGLEFPDGLLSRDVFENVDSIASAIESVLEMQP